MKQIPKILPAFLILALGIIISFWIYSMYKKRALSEKENQISAVIENNYRDIQKDLAVSFSSVEILRSIFEEQQNISKEEFKNFTASLLKSNPGIKALSWVTKITNEERAVFENKISKTLNNHFAITKRNRQNEAIANEESPFYFQVTYIEPLNENNKALGFNIYSDSASRQTIDLAINKGEIVITPRIRIVQDTLGYSFLGITPVFIEPEKTATTANVKGLISAVFSVDNLINAALANSKNPKITIAIVDVTNNKNELIYGNEAVFGKTGQFIEKRMLPVRGRTWELNFMISPVYYQIANIKAYLIGGIVISVLLFMLLLFPVIKERKRSILAEKLFKEQKLRVHAQESLSESEEKYRFMFANNPQPMWIYDLETLAILEINNAAINHYGYSREEFLAMAIKDIRPKEDLDAFFKNINQPGKPLNFSGEWRHIKKNGEIINVEITSHLITFNGRKARHIMVNDITERKRLERLLNLEKYLLEIITQNAPLPKILEEIVLSVEALSENTIASILLLDDEGIHVHYGAAPHLPEGYNNALEGASIGPNAGSCGTAAYRKEAVIVADIETDPLWDNYRELASAHGLRACWSTPIINSKGQVLGTFAMYYREPRSPKDEDFKLIEKATHLAEIAIERKQAEENLSLSNQTIQNIIDNAPSLIYVFNLNGEFLLANKKFEKLLGIASGKLIGHTREEFFSKEISEEHRDHDLKVINSKREISFEEENIEADGKHFYLTAKFPLFNAEGNIYAVGGISTDVTESKQAEEALKESEEKFRNAVMNAPFPILIHSENGKVVLINDTWNELSGYSQQEIPTIEKWTELAYGEKIETVKADINLLYKIDKRKDEGEYEIRTKIGEKRIWEFSSAPIGHDSEKNRLVISMALDVTERKIAEDELKRNEQILKLFVKHSPAAIAMFDKEMKYMAVSDRFKLDYGLGEKNIMGRSHYEIFPELKEEWKAFHQRCLAGEILKSDEEQFVQNNGSIGWLRWEIHPWYHKEGEIGGLILFSEVITERKKAREEINILNAELEQRVIERTAQLDAANKELQTFTYSVSHDLKAPLRGIDGYSKLLEELYAKDLNEEAKYFINTIRKGTKQMNRLIEDLLDYSRLERATLQMESIKIKQFINSAADSFDVDASTKKNLFNIQVPDIEIVADSKGLSIALRNLIENAIKFSAINTNPKIEISLNEEPDFWLISVKDNGIGFDMKYKDRIFEIFQQLNLPEEFPGTGIGLAMVHKSMEKMDGKVWAESTLGNGAVFFLQIPKIKI